MSSFRNEVSAPGAGFAGVIGVPLGPLGGRLIPEYAL